MEENSQAQDFLDNQIHFPGERSNVSVVTYYDDNEHTYCPYCGKAQSQRLDSNGLSLSCDCEGFKEEQKVLDEINKKQIEIEKLQKEVSDLFGSIKEKALVSGRKLCAQHFLLNKEDRDSFESDIKKFIGEEK